MKALALPPGLRGFDADSRVSVESAEVLHRAGYRFALRYVRRTTKRESDFSREEVAALHLAGIAVMPVQHVESALSWHPTDDKGRAYGDGAANAATELGLALGTTVWLDLEGIASGVGSEQIIRYCNLWFDRVAIAGFQPGIYVGWHARLSSSDLYRRLRFTRYWSAYNLNLDQYPAVRGVCLKQHLQVRPVGLKFDLDPDLSLRDALGETATVSAPSEWDPS